MSYNQQGLGNHPYTQGYNQNNVYGNTENIGRHQNDGDAWNQAWGDEDNFNVNTKPPERDPNQKTQNIGNI